jgi:hypothetical protein
MKDAVGYVTGREAATEGSFFRKFFVEKVRGIDILRRIYNFGDDPNVDVSGFQTNGLNLNLCVRQRYLQPAVVIAPSPPLHLFATMPDVLPGLSGNAVQLLEREHARGDKCLTHSHVETWGKRVSDECNGNFANLTLARRTDLVSLLWVACGLDPFATKKIRERKLVCALRKTGNVCSPGLYSYHIWLVRNCRSEDKRLRIGCDSGIVSPWSLADTLAIETEHAKDAQPSYHTGKMGLYARKPQCERIHPRVIVSVPGLLAGIEAGCLTVQQRSFDLKFGFIVQRKSTLLPNLFVGDEI